MTRWVLLTGVVSAFQLFTYVYVLTEGGPLHATDTLVYRAYRSGWELLEFGYAGAIAVFLWVLVLLVTRAAAKLLGRGVEYA